MNIHIFFPSFWNSAIIPCHVCLCVRWFAVPKWASTSIGDIVMWMLLFFTILSVLNVQSESEPGILVTDWFIDDCRVGGKHYVESERFIIFFNQKLSNVENDFRLSFHNLWSIFFKEQLFWLEKDNNNKELDTTEKLLVGR